MERELLQIVDCVQEVVEHTLKLLLEERTLMAVAYLSEYKEQLRAGKEAVKREMR